MACPSATGARAGGASFLGAAGTSAGAAVMADDSAASFFGAADGDA